ncbi:hypothetical protein HC891_14055 [Candidatus Gracilibacteria bacterium]|nr:hypothetical protein [Candidatus Gracilibacteria bacterium]
MLPYRYQINFQGGISMAIRCGIKNFLRYKRENNRRVVVLMLLILLEFQLVQCSYADLSKKTDWHLIIPDNYQGFLVIMYNCPEGDILPIRNNVIEVDFSPDGVFCASENAFAWEGQITASTQSGKAVFGPALWDQRGYGFYGDGRMTIHSPVQQQFDVYWTGNLEYLASIRNEPEYTEQLNVFLEARFNIQMPGSGR